MIDNTVTFKDLVEVAQAKEPNDFPLTKRLARMLPDTLGRSIALVDREIGGSGYAVFWFDFRAERFTRTVIPDLTEEWAAWLVLRMP